MRLEPLQNLGGRGDRLRRAVDMNPTILDRDIHPQRVADFPYVLIAGTKQRQQRLGTNDR